MTYVRLQSLPFQGLDLNTAKVRMDPGAGQRCDNLDLEREPGTRARAGYARLLDDLSASINVTGSPTRIVIFERDDDENRLVIAHGSKVEATGLGATEW